MAFQNTKWGDDMIQSELAFTKLQQMIEEGGLPSGSMISERALMEVTGLGRTPVREAVQKLARSSMVRVHPSKGIEVPADSVENQLSRLEVRRPMEVLAVGLACMRATQRDLEKISEMAARLNGDFVLKDYNETVRQTHDLIIDAAHNPYIETLMAPLQALSRRFWMTHIRDEKVDIDRGKTLHREILEAISLRDGNKGEEASLALNDYLVDFALQIIGRRVSGAVPDQRP